MDLLRKVDLQAALGFVGTMSDAGADAAGFAQVGVDALPRLVASEITTLSVCDLVSGRRHVVGSPGSSLSAEDRACFDRYFNEHPLVRYHGLEHGPGARRISDSQPFARFRHTELYSEYYRRIGIDHVVAVPVEVDSGTLVSFVLNRSRRDFSDRECALLDLVGVHLSRQYRRVRAQQRLASDRTALLESLTAREREVVRWLAAGKTDRDIAALLGCSHRTVQKHLERSYAKLGVETRTAAVMRALGVRVQ
jgi:DNA-binding CsgD family transcriptional regulator